MRQFSKLLEQRTSFEFPALNLFRASDFGFRIWNDCHLSFVKRPFPWRLELEGRSLAAKRSGP
jgi:hypothetical protein